MASTSDSTRSKEIESDLQLLLECLKCQLYDPASVKQSLLAIGSLCSTNSSAKDILREDGGLDFILNLLHTTQVEDVQETALYTLGCVIENNAHSQKHLATDTLFNFVYWALKRRQTKPRQLQTACYLLLTLVTGSSHGQTLARASECLDALFNIFKTSLPIKEELIREVKGKATWFEELEEKNVDVWAAATSAICGCLNNPQNDENQRLCATIFPTAFAYLQDHDSATVVRPITSLIGLAAANNYHNQRRVLQAGGVKVLISALHRSVNRIQQPDHQDMAACITTSLDTLVANNADLSMECGKMGMVSLVCRLLQCPSYRPPSLLRYIVTLGHLLENSVENRKQFVEIGGIGTMVALLTQTEDSEILNAAKYVLHNCVTEASNQGSSSLQPKLLVRNRTASSVKQSNEMHRAHTVSTYQTPEFAGGGMQEMIEEKIKSVERNLAQACRNSCDEKLTFCQQQEKLLTQPQSADVLNGAATGTHLDTLRANVSSSNIQQPVTNSVLPTPDVSFHPANNVPNIHGVLSRPPYNVQMAYVNNVPQPNLMSQPLLLTYPVQTFNQGYFGLPLEVGHSTVNNQLGNLQISTITTPSGDHKNFLLCESGEKQNTLQRLPMSISADAPSISGRNVDSSAPSLPTAAGDSRPTSVSLPNHHKNVRNSPETKTPKLQSRVKTKNGGQKTVIRGQELKHQEKTNEEEKKGRKHLRRAKSRRLLTVTAPEAPENISPHDQELARACSPLTTTTQDASNLPMSEGPFLEGFSKDLLPTSSQSSPLLEKTKEGLVSNKDENASQTFLQPKSPALLITRQSKETQPTDTPRSRKKGVGCMMTPKYSVKKVPRIPASRHLVHSTPQKKFQITKCPTSVTTNHPFIPPSPCHSEFDLELLKVVKSNNSRASTRIAPSPTDRHNKANLTQGDSQQRSSQSSFVDPGHILPRQNQHHLSSTGIEDVDERGQAKIDDSLSDSTDFGGSMYDGKVPVSSMCPACHPPASCQGMLLNSRNYSIVIETNPFTCSKHRLIRRTERRIASQLRVGRGIKARPLTALSHQTPLSERERGRSDLYSFNTSEDSENELCLPTPPLLPTPSPVVHPAAGRQIRRSRVPYTDQEIVNLREGVRKLGKFWHQILVTYDFHPSRSAVDLMHKYKRLTSASGGGPSPRLVRNPFSMAEERRLRRGVRLYGYNWKIISKAFKFARGRRPQDLKDKWHNMHKHT